MKADGMVMLGHVFPSSGDMFEVYGDKDGNLFVNTDNGLKKYVQETHGDLYSVEGYCHYIEDSEPKPKPEPIETYDISPVGTIIEVVALKEIKNPDYVGPGDAAEYCAEHNLYHTVSQPGEKWFVDIYSESGDFGFRSSFEEELSFFKSSPYPLGGARCYKNYEDIVRDRRRVDTSWRRRGVHMSTEDLQFVRIMPPRTVTVDGITETL